jgi:hypothetical protein
MSHLPERKEKICLNCKSVIYGRFCHVCGQQNTEPKETFWGLVTHFVYDVTHFDGKFFATTKHLLFRPGYLAYEYLRGRRASYLNPIKMYVFTSAFFFILFFSFIVDKDADEAELAGQKAELIAERAKFQDSLKKVTDTLVKQKLEKKIKRLNNKIRYFGQTGIVKVADDEQDSTYQNSDWTVVGSTKWPRTVREYDSIQKTLSPEKKDGWLVRTGKQKAIAINEKYRGNEREFWRRVNEKFTHSIPQMMFVSLPLVALILQLLYIRRNKYYYVNHVVFTVNLYIAIYLLFLVFYGFAALFSATGIRIFEVLATVTWIVIFFYIYKSLRNFYQQRRAKTVLKFILFLLLFMTMISLLMGIYFLTSALQI